MPRNISYITAPFATLVESPERAGECASELLFGEGVKILSPETENGWVPIRNQTDGYEGYVEAKTLAPLTAPPTHKVTALRSYLYPAPDFKTHPVHLVSFLSRLTPTGRTENGFAEIQGNFWIWAADLAPITQIIAHPIDTALRFLGTPYKWGGRTSLGLDCSALVQLAMMGANIPCPRDTKDQILSLGDEMPIDIKTCQRGDIVFFNRHVGIMVDQNNILNATARHMCTVIEPFHAVCAAYDGILKIRRVS